MKYANNCLYKNFCANCNTNCCKNCQLKYNITIDKSVKAQLIRDKRKQQLDEENRIDLANEIMAKKSTR